MTPGPRFSVLFATEGTYPYHKGGVSTWCHALINNLDDVDFSIFAVTMHPYLEMAYDLAPNVRDVLTVPLWSTDDMAEYGPYDSAASFLRQRGQTMHGVIRERFVPAYDRLLRETTAAKADPAAVAAAVTRLYEHFTEFDYHQTMNDRGVWDVFVRVVTEAWSRDEPDRDVPALGELAEAWRLLTRFLTVLASPIPRTNLTHSAAAAFCGLPCIVAKQLWNTPYLLTEHGVHLREQYLNLGRSIPSYFVRWFLLRVASAVADVNHAYADQLSPVCRHELQHSTEKTFVDEYRASYLRLARAPADVPQPPGSAVVTSIAAHRFQRSKR